MKVFSYRFYQVIRSVFSIIIILLLLGASQTVLGQSAGKVMGTVRDARDQSKLIGAIVNVPGTYIGATTNMDGEFTILNVPPGVYSFQVRMLNYKTAIIQEVAVASGQTTVLNVDLEYTEIEGEEVLVIYEAPVVQLDIGGSTDIFSRERLAAIRPADITSLVQSTTGFKVDPEGKMHVRGSRAGDVAIIFEGVDLRDPLVDTQIHFDLSTEAIDEISILTSGFSAEFGRVMGGVIQITTAEGRPDKYTGRFEIQTDRILNSYSFNSDRVELAFGGPIPQTRDLLGKPITFYFTGIVGLTDTYIPYDMTRPSNDYMGIGINLPERQQNDYSASLKLAYNLTESQKMTLFLSQSYSQWDLYPRGEGGVSGNYGYAYLYNLENRPWAYNKRFSGTLTYTNQLSSKTFYEVKFTVFRTHSAVQTRGKSPGEFTMFDEIEDDGAIWYREDANGVIDREYVLDSDGNGFMDGFVDANGNGVFDGGGEGYEDLNRNGRWDRGEDWVDLNGNGIYDFAEPWTDVVNPLTGENNIGVWDPWDPYIDLNGNGRWDPAEPQLAEHDWNTNGRWDGERFQDANGNGRYDPWEPWEDLNGNYYWDPGEPFIDTNGNGRFDYSEGYDDMNLNGLIDTQEIMRLDNAGRLIDDPEPYIDGDYWWDTGEPFIDEPDPITGEYNGRWDPGEIWFDLPSSANLQTGAGWRFIGSNPVLNGRYDGPNGLFDEYELFCKPADWSYHSDRSRPVIYTFNERAQGRDWPADIFRYIPGKSTWINRTIHDVDDPVFNLPTGSYSEGIDPFIDYNNNGVWDPVDGFLNPGTWDQNALWQERISTEYALKLDIQSQVSRNHEIKSGLEIKFRDLSMQSIGRPDLPYQGEIDLPEGSLWPDRGGSRDFYNYNPWEGAAYIQDKMEFEGLIVNAGVRTDFIIHDQKVVDEFRERVIRDEPGAIYAQRGAFRISPRLAVSHPITETAKLFFNYGHFYQAPQFQYFYRSATSNFNINTVIGNPNLEYEKTVQYEIGVNTQLTEEFVLTLASYYKDQYDMISTQDERWKNLTLDRYANLDYGRMRGFEFTFEKRPSRHYAFTFNYDFSFSYGKSSDQHANVETRLRNVPYNYDEHPLDWDETHKVNAHLTVQYGSGQHARLLGMVLPDDWMLTVMWQFGSGLPYTPSTYTTGIDNPNLILPNSARYPWHESTTLKFEKYYNVNPNTNSRLVLGITVNNLFNKKNVYSIYSQTGSPTQSVHPLNPSYNPNDTRSAFDANPRHYGPARQIMFRIGVSL